jgi:hypothetical protein
MALNAMTQNTLSKQNVEPMQALRHTLNRQLECFISQRPIKNYLALLPSEIREELYHHQYTFSRVIYEMHRGKSILGDYTYLKITNNIQWRPRCNVLPIDKDILTKTNLSEALELLYETGEVHLQIGGEVFIHIVNATFTPLYFPLFENPEWNKKMESKPQNIPVSLEFFNALFALWEK